MSEPRHPGPSAETVEEVLRAELAHGDVAIATARPVLRHLLASGDHGLFSDRVIATVRGMMVDIARQMLMALAKKADISARGDFADERGDAIAVSLLNDTDLLGHAHALTIEGQVVERLHQRGGIDPVLSPLLQNLAASDDAGTAALAMRVLSAQARFVQQHRRMELPLTELPAELRASALAKLREHNDDYGAEAAAVEDDMDASYRYEDSRVGQMESLLASMGHRAVRALEVDNAGLSIFATALAMASEQTRDTVLLSFGENQCARLALGLRAAGLGQSAVEEQFLYLHPDIELPAGFETLRADRAASLLGSADANLVDAK